MKTPPPIAPIDWRPLDAIETKLCALRATADRLAAENARDIATLEAIAAHHPKPEAYPGARVLEPLLAFLALAAAIVVCLAIL
ncbi:MAG: hypothetical protein ACOYD4_04165 [Solirubrobacterales bacterium]